MNIPQKFLIIALLGLDAVHSACGQVVISTATVNQAVPDGSLSGLASSVTINSAAAALSDLAVTVSLSAGPGGGFAGDLYATLVHGNDSIVLLNRPGRNTNLHSGYGDGTDINITFSALGTDDIHLYRQVLNGSPSVALTGPLIGAWQPDGRTASPLSVVNASSRNPSMNIFNSTSPAGLWTLFVADLSGGGDYQLNQWTISMTGVAPVPEPVETAAVFALAASVAGLCRRRFGR
jgi:subtilisin-like proprotein convertase family protein